MAPMEHIDIRHASTEVLRQEASILKRRGVPDIQLDAVKRDGGDNNSNPSSNDDSGGGGGKSNDGGKKDKGSSSTQGNNNKDNSPPTPTPNYLPPPPVTIAAAPSPTTVMSTVIVIQTTTATPIAASTSSKISSSSTSKSSVSSSSSIPVVQPAAVTSSSSLSSTSIPTVTVYTAFPTSIPPRKGLNTEGDVPPSSTVASAAATSTIWIATTVFQSSALIAATALALPDTSDDNDDKNNHHKDSKHNELSPLAEHLLVAAGAIGAFIMVAAGIWFFARMRKIDLFGPARNRKIEKGGSRGWYGWRKQQQPDYASDPPPEYHGGDFGEEKKFSQQPMEYNYRPLTLPPLAAPLSSASALARSNSQHSQLTREALMSNAAPFSIPPAVQQAIAQQSGRQTFYNPGEAHGSLSRHDTHTTTASAARSGYNNASTYNTLQTSQAYDPNQREVNHLSYLSSLSSGFGDGLIMPEPTVVGANEPRQSQSYRNTRKFSWIASRQGTPGPAGDRDTMYTTTSEAPRFRTVNSWVAQQSTRIEKSFQADDNAPDMPPIPLPLQGSTGPVHQRNMSEDPAFRHHPGDEIEFGRGSRVPSSILDRKVDANLR